MGHGPEVGLWVTVLELERRGVSRAVVHSPSMRPVMWPGTRVWLRRADAGALRPGDPVVFRRDGGPPCLHRLLRRDGGALITRGDASPREDAPVAPSEVIGTVEGLVAGPWQWRAAPRWIQRAGRRALLPALPLLRVALRAGGRGRRVLRALR